MTNAPPTWHQWFEAHHLQAFFLGSHLPQAYADQPWRPTEADQQAAWELYTELRSRIATQPLHFRSGDEETALDSLYKLFGFARDIVKKHGPECRQTAAITLYALNTHLRPLTAKWHKKKLAKQLLNDDERRYFRRELARVRKQLTTLTEVMGRIAEADAYVGELAPAANEAEAEAPGPITATYVDSIMHSRAMHRAEMDAIAARRRSAGITAPATGSEEPSNLVGLACSGGGIRSATFCLGVTQALARRGLLPHFDYLSTVSGGGYFGAFISSYLNDADHERVGLQPQKLPFEEPGSIEPRPIRNLRNNSKYLLKGGLWGQARIAGLVAFGILVNLITLIPTLFLALALSKLAATCPWFASGEFGRSHSGLVAMDWTLAGIALGLPFVYRFRGKYPDWVTRYERFAIGLLLAIVGFWGIGELAPNLYQSVLGAFDYHPASAWGFFALLPFVLAAGAFASGLASLPGRVLLILSGLSGPLLLLMSYFVLDSFTNAGIKTVGLLLGCAALSTLWLSLINANDVSPHRYYRNRLAETYLLRKGRHDAVDPQPLSRLGALNPAAPYHLINAAVNLPGSQQAELRGRNADFFLFSRHYCGSPVLGYCKTDELEAKDSQLDLGTAMAISGAAASGYMGTGTIKGLEFWLSLLNIRLAYWLPNPKRLTELKANRNPTPFALWRELFGQMDENGKYVNLSDGGHIENLGIYELLRRRCKYIVAIDGEADPTMSFGSLMTLIRYAQIDFGITITLDVNDIRKNQAGFSKGHFALGTIDYGAGGTGYLLYIKSSLTGNERDYIRNYQSRHPSFPHETTADQFFEEAQFEAYRALGQHIGDDLFHSELIGNATAASLPDWMEALAGSLLERG